MRRRHHPMPPSALARTPNRRDVLRFFAAAAVAAPAATLRPRSPHASDRPVPTVGRTTAAQSAEFVAKAIYLNPLVTDAQSGLAGLLDLVDRTELNALVVDVKEDGVYYRTEVPLFWEAGAVAPLYDVTDLLASIRARDVYAIARLVVFKDPYVAAARPDLAVLDETTGAPWLDYGGIAWLNPFERENWEATAALAVELAGLGFDEIQFDYVRFPSDGDLATMDFGRPVTEDARAEAIAGFLGYCADELAPTGAKVAADVFGYTLLLDDIGIGQNVGVLAPVVDYLCPMVYPSHFPDGSLDVGGHPNDFPYETIQISMDAGKEKLPGMASKLRPWLQDFSLPGLSAYDTADVRAQIDAAEEAGVGGWMIWNAANEYHEDAFEPVE